MSACSVARRAESAPRSSSALRPSSASLTRALRPLTAWPKALRCSAGQRAERRHQLGDAPLLAERGDAHALDGAEIAGGARSRRGARCSRAARSVSCVIRCHPGPAPGAQSRVPQARADDDARREQPVQPASGPWIAAARRSGMTGYAAFSLRGGLIDERLEAGGVLDGEVGQHLAVDGRCRPCRGRR